ncbi:MAG: phospholipase/carboxylesterase [Mycobacteriales bacterium]
MRLHIAPALTAGQPEWPPGLHRCAVGGERPALLRVPAGQPTGLAMLFHGAGGRPEGALDLLADQADAAGLLVLAPASTGRTWDLVDGPGGPDLQQCAALLAQVLSGWPVRYEDRLVGGFSDGASYALSLGLSNGDVFSFVAGFSPGFVAAPTRRGRPRVFVSHGTEDAVLPVADCGRPIALQLRGTGYDVTYQEFADGHLVPAEAVDHALRLWRS